MSRCDNCRHLLIKGDDEQCGAPHQFPDFSCFSPLESGHPQRVTRAFGFEDNQTLVALSIPAQKAQQDHKQDPNSVMTGQLTLFSYSPPTMITGRRSLMTLRHAIDWALGIREPEGPK